MMMLTGRLSGRARVRESDETRAIPGRQGFSRCTCIRTCKHGAACSLQRNRSNWVNETPSLLTHVQTHARPLQAHRLHAGVLYAQRERVSPLNFCSLRPGQAPDVLTFYQGEPQAPPTAGISGYFCGRSNSVILHSAASCNRECEREIHAYRSYLSPWHFYRGHMCVMLPSWNNVFIFHWRFHVYWRLRLRIFLARRIRCENRKWDVYNWEYNAKIHWLNVDQIM